ncbi:hypothetical protein A1QC_11580 [Vibrio rumoiensis 1S-45]|uniref:EamA domain-containing protein n=1 Tax=Vibrio rumoiensis 1S-45 TaxID=1188252 RepID=A0A1E5DZW9_9VIBR|nr:hypothetical protein A1QC_11580 [Vibrio rumoiensis 1S-45]
MNTLFFTLFALIAFAANSVLARLALTNDNIDAFSFTLVRLVSGAVMLFLLLTIRTLFNSDAAAHSSYLKPIKGNWASALMLFIYAAGFSIAYLSLDTGTGALILFGAVQITIIITNLFIGKPLSKQEWLGMSLAFMGFVLLVLPNLSTPSIKGFMLMAVAGIAWAGYTLKGRSCDDPLADTTGNFIKSLPFGVALCLYLVFNSHSSSFPSFTSYGLILAITSGAVTSGLGYAIWYVALRSLTSTQAGILQLSVPAIAALGGVVFLSETMSLTFIIASTMILGGIFLTTFNSIK